MTDRFECLGINKDETIIADKYNKCPLSDVRLPSRIAPIIKDWLNENIEDYKRFKLEVNWHNGNRTYILWDDKMDDYIKFRPICSSCNPKQELQDYVDWLNELWESKND